MKVSDMKLLGPDFARNGKENVTVRNLLLHNAGFPPDPNPNYCKSGKMQKHIMEPLLACTVYLNIHGSKV